MSETTIEKPKRRDPVYILIILLLLIGMGIMLVQFLNAKKELEKCAQNQQVLSENLESAAELLGSDTESFKSDLENLLKEYDEVIDQNKGLASQNKELMDSLTANREKVAKLLSSAQNNKYLQNELYKYKKEAETLRTIMKGYVHTIDSLMIENSNLRFEVNVKERELNTAQETIVEYKQKTTKLEQTVEAGKGLKTMGIKANAMRSTSGGNAKETDKAKRVDMFKVCFTVRENSLADAGEKTIYLRVLTPGGIVMDEGVIRSFKVKSNEIQYTSSREVDYQNADVDMCIYSKVGAEVAKGTYVIELYAEGERIGQTTVDLK